jgi:hypothetical protein
VMCCFDLVLGFCKSFSHAAGKPHSPYMPDNGEFTVLTRYPNFRAVFIYSALVEAIVDNQVMRIGESFIDLHQIVNQNVA